MIRALSIGGILLILTGCAEPEEEFVVPLGRSGPVEADVMEEPVAAAPVASEVACDDPGDGIGGTGCPVE